jgi:endonuclease YncB( thermonuclease family)
MAWNLSIYLDRHVARDSISTSSEIPARTLRSRGAGRYSARRAAAIAAWMIWQRSSVYPSGQIIEVIDGDTVRLNGAVYRLARIRAGATIRCRLWRAVS